jgi:hypothetical protein
LNEASDMKGAIPELLSNAIQLDFFIIACNPDGFKRVLIKKQAGTGMVLDIAKSE